jgi:hypothetical protein
LEDDRGGILKPSSFKEERISWTKFNISDGSSIKASGAFSMHGPYLLFWRLLWQALFAGHLSKRNHTSTLSFFGRFHLSF